MILARLTPSAAQTRNLRLLRQPLCLPSPLLQRVASGDCCWLAASNLCIDDGVCRFAGPR